MDNFLNGLMRFLVHSKQWISVRSIDLQFIQKNKNWYARMVVDGMNPFGNQNTHHSMWPVLIVLYNLLPWLVVRHLFISLFLIISGTISYRKYSLQLWIHLLVSMYILHELLLWLMTYLISICLLLREYRDIIEV